MHMTARSFRSSSSSSSTSLTLSALDSSSTNACFMRRSSSSPSEVIRFPGSTRTRWSVRSLRRSTSLSRRAVATTSAASIASSSNGAGSCPTSRLFTTSSDLRVSSSCMDRSSASRSFPACPAELMSRAERKVRNFFADLLSGSKRRHASRVITARTPPMLHRITLSRTTSEGGDLTLSEGSRRRRSRGTSPVDLRRSRRRMESREAAPVGSIRTSA
mmetsp:Transcript_16281/g.51163  ORF Transcript_16281/g.51163 Transcript_16281/m.51163 type:complete len:217 (-) Transcript_16281:208-858(-)